MIFALQGCTDVAISGAQAVYNRHSIQQNVTDQLITMRANQALFHRTREFDNSNITVATYHREVLLAGQVPASWQKQKAQQIISNVPHVKRIYNLLTISGPSSPLTRISDAWLTSKVKAKLLASNDVDASQVKVVTENGNVYLMGVLRPDEAQAAVEIASHTDGVESVVKIFSYMTISKTLT